MSIKKKSKIWLILINFILFLFIIVGLIVGFSLLPFKNNFKIMSVMSGSMEPTIKIGELIIIRPGESYHVGDIIAFRSPGATSEKSVITHRISEETTPGNSTVYRTKGDANNTVDSNLVKKEDILGKYSFGIPYLGYLIGYVKTLPGLVIIIIIPATIIIYEEARKIGREAREIKKRRKQRKDKLKSEIEKEEKTELKPKESKKISHDIKVHKK